MVNALFLILPFISLLAIGIFFEALSYQKTNLRYVCLYLFFLPLFILAFFFLRVTLKGAVFVSNLFVKTEQFGLTFSIDYMASIIFFGLIVTAFYLCLIELFNRYINLSVFGASIGFFVPFLFCINNAFSVLFVVLFDAVFVVALINHLKKVINFRTLSVFCRFYFLSDFLIFLGTLFAWRFEEFNRAANHDWARYSPILIVMGIACRFLPLLFIQRKLFINPRSLLVPIHGIFMLLSVINTIIFFYLVQKFASFSAFFYGSIFILCALILCIVFMFVLDKCFIQKMDYLFLMINIVSCLMFLFYPHPVIVWINACLYTLFFVGLMAIQDEERFIAKSSGALSPLRLSGKLVQQFVGYPFYYMRLFAAEIIVPFYSNFIFYRFFKIVIGSINLPLRFTSSGNVRRSLLVMIFWVVLFGAMWKIK